jgi:formate hydrogenlyase subunit 3/multisubunit Na+/H+ antiporter MnhD subunit
VFWVLLLAVWAGMNLVVMGRDLFNLYVALELLTFAAVPLVCLDGRKETLDAALRYLMFALLGSVLYLLGAVLLYGAYGTLDIGLLAARVQPEPAAWLAGALMTVGLLAKTALFPLHLWLPPAHAGAPPAASAILSALVVKGSFVLVIRLWFEVMPGLWSVAGTQLLGALGAAAILYGSVLALRQQRLKLLIAYSTVAQIGYLFLVFPLAFDAEMAQLVPGIALTGGVLQLVSHAFAKAGMFMAAGLIAVALGHDRVADLGGIARILPVSLFAFALAGVSLVGLPPSGGFAAKWLLLSAALGTGQWWWAVVIVLGGLLTGGYLVMVLMRALSPPAAPLTTCEARGALPRGHRAGAVDVRRCCLACWRWVRWSCRRSSGAGPCRWQGRESPGRKLAARRDVGLPAAVAARRRVCAAAPAPAGPAVAGARAGACGCPARIGRAGARARRGPADPAVRPRSARRRAARRRSAAVGGRRRLCFWLHARDRAPGTLHRLLAAGRGRLPRRLRGRRPGQPLCHAGDADIGRHRPGDSRPDTARLACRRHLPAACAAGRVAAPGRLHPPRRRDPG